jgi:hypothetical protein
MNRKVTFEVDEYFIIDDEDTPELWKIVWVEGAEFAQIIPGYLGQTLETVEFCPVNPIDELENTLIGYTANLGLKVR